MTRFSNFTDEELDAMEEAFCNEGLRHLVFEIRGERERRTKTFPKYNTVNQMCTEDVETVNTLY